MVQFHNLYCKVEHGEFECSKINDIRRIYPMREDSKVANLQGEVVLSCMRCACMNAQVH